MSNLGTSGDTLWLMASQRLPNAVVWECEACGGHDVIVSLESRMVRLVCTSPKVIGIGIELDDLVAAGRAECMHCAGRCRAVPPSETRMPGP